MQKEKQKLLLITGPTAAGKTDLALSIARDFAGEILCADSMQIYRDMHIGTARPLPEEQAGIPHHLFGEIAPDAPYSVAAYQQEAQRRMQDIWARDKLPIAVGGTGLYIHALLYQVDFTDAAPDDALREQLSQQYDAPGGADRLYIELLKKDPAAAARIHKNDTKRLIRRLEILQNEAAQEPYAFRRPQEHYDTLVLGVNKDRAQLYRDINLRVDQMMAQGLCREAEAVYRAYGANIPAFLAIGYKEFLPYFAGEATLAEVTEKIKQNTRHFAKRQLTWFRREPQIKWFFAEEYADRAQELAAMEREIAAFLHGEEVGEDRLD